MGKFNAQARRVRNIRLPIQVRVIAFHACIGSYCWLTRQKFQATRERFAAAYWITKTPPPTVVGLRVRHIRTEFEQPDAQSWFLIQAIDALQRERHDFLHRLRRFEQRRIREKFRGRRRASRAELDALYSPDFLVVR
jgi:hypothetical protein